MSSVALRFDKGTIRKSYVSPEGYLTAEAVFAKDGVLEYRMPNGSVRRELRLPEENKKALGQFGMVPVTLEHPPFLLTKDNATSYAKGLTDSNVVYDKNGFVKGVITTFDSEAIDKIQNGEASEISAGYTCRTEDTPGVWRGQNYDAIQRDIQVNHVCFTAKGRAGQDVRVYLDSQQEDIGYQVEMGTTTIRRDGVDYSQVPEGFATLAASEFKRLDSLQKELEKAKEVTENYDSLFDRFDEQSNENERLQARADAFEVKAESATAILEELGYYFDSDDEAFYYREDMCGDKTHKKDMKKHDMEEEDEEYEDMEDEEHKKNMGYGKKKDSISEILSSWHEADQLIPGLSAEKFDSELDCHGVRKLVLSKLDSKFAEMSDHFDSEDRDDRAYVCGRYDSLKASGSNAGTGYHVQELQNVVMDSKNGLQNKQPRLDARSERLMKACQEPLSMSRS